MHPGNYYVCVEKNNRQKRQTKRVTHIIIVQVKFLWLQRSLLAVNYQGKTNCIHFLLAVQTQVSIRQLSNCYSNLKLKLLFYCFNTALLLSILYIHQTLNVQCNYNYKHAYFLFHFLHCPHRWHHVEHWKLQPTLLVVAMVEPKRKKRDNQHYIQ